MSECGDPTDFAVPCPGDHAMQAGAIRALLPRGWAWDAADYDGTLMAGRTNVMAHIFQLFHELACALPREFHCFSVDKTLESWNADYGLPDDCGLNDLCAKVVAVGGQNCESYVDLGALLGFDICCADVPVEIQPGCWNLGCDQMPPPAVLYYGGSELGYASIGNCVEPETGSNLGFVDTDCRMAGYVEADEEPEEETTLPPCAIEPTCVAYYPKFGASLLPGCFVPAELRYEGTAHHWMVATNDQYPPAIPSVEGYSVVGCWDMGVSELCTPEQEPVMCFIRRMKPAHTVVVRRYCENGVFKI